MLIQSGSSRPIPALIVSGSWAESSSVPWSRRQLWESFSIVEIDWSAFYPLYIPATISKCLSRLNPTLWRIGKCYKTSSVSRSIKRNLLSLIYTRKFESGSVVAFDRRAAREAVELNRDGLHASDCGYTGDFPLRPVICTLVSILSPSRISENGRALSLNSNHQVEPRAQRPLNSHDTIGLPRCEGILRRCQCQRSL